MKSHLRLVPPPPDGDEPTAGATPPTLTPLQRKRVEEALPLVETIAAQVARRHRTRVTKEDLLAVGTIALFEATLAFDAERDTDFKHFARSHVRGRMLDTLRREHFSRRARVEQAMERGFVRYESDPLLDVDVANAPEDEDLDQAERASCSDALAAALLAGLLEAHGGSPEDEAIAAEEQALAMATLKRAFATLLPREQDLIRFVYEDGLSLDEAGKSLRVRHDSTRRLHGRALGKLRSFLLATPPEDQVWTRLEGSMFSTG